MAKPVEPIMWGTLMLREGQDAIVRGPSHDIFFHFSKPDLTDIPHDRVMRTVFIGIPEGPHGATGTHTLDTIETLYRVDRFAGSDVVEVSYTLSKR